MLFQMRWWQVGCSDAGCSVKASVNKKGFESGFKTHRVADQKCMCVQKKNKTAAMNVTLAARKTQIVTIYSMRKRAVAAVFTVIIHVY